MFLTQLSSMNWVKNMQISQVKTQKVKVEEKKLLASTRPPIALNQHFYKLHFCPQLPHNLVSFPNPLALEAENLSSGNGGVLVDPGAISQGKQAASALTSSP